MSVIYVLLPVALLFAAGAVAAYLWAARHGQFDDLETPPLRMLHDDEEITSADGSPSPRPASGRRGRSDR